MRLFGVVVVALVGCTKKNPTYCDDATPCETGVCDVSINTCVDLDSPPGPADARVDAGDSACELAGGRIVFATDRDGEFEIATMNADGSDLQVLTSNTWKDEDPRLSPNGDQIVWLSSASGSVEVWVMNVDGSEAGSVSSADNSTDGPRWSPSADRIAFEQDGDVLTVNPDGTDLTNLTGDSFGFEPDWSPDGTRLIFGQYGDPFTANDDEIAIMDRDGTDVETIVPNQGRVLHRPRWSPDASHIAFYGIDLEGNSSLWVGNVSGAGTYRAEPARSPSWSSNGLQIAYVGGSDLFTIPATGSDSMNLNVTAGDVVGGEPAWAPDSSRIAFEVEIDGTSDIFAIDADGGTAVNLTEDPGEDTLGSWAPCP